MKHQKLILSSVTIFMVTSFMLLQPIMSAEIPAVRMKRLNALIERSVTDGRIDAWSFWQVREFFSRGEIELFMSQTFRTKPQMKQLEYKSLISTCLPVEYSRFSSHRSISESYFVSADCALPTLNVQNSVTVLDTPMDRIIKTPENSFMLMLRDPSEMAQVDGFLEFDQRNQEFKQTYNMSKILTITSFSLN